MALQHPDPPRNPGDAGSGVEIPTNSGREVAVVAPPSPSILNQVLSAATVSACPLEEVNPSVLNTKASGCSISSSAGGVGGFRVEYASVDGACGGGTGGMGPAAPDRQAIHGEGDGGCGRKEQTRERSWPDDVKFRALGNKTNHPGIILSDDSSDSDGDRRDGHDGDERGVLPTPPTRDRERSTPVPLVTSAEHRDVSARENPETKTPRTSQKVREGEADPTRATAGEDSDMALEGEKVATGSGSEGSGGGHGAGEEGLRLKGKSVEAKGSTGVSPMQKRNRRELKVSKAR